VRVLLTTDTAGGVWTYTIELARALQAEGVATTIATLGPPPSAGQRAEAAALGLALHTRTCRLPWMEEPWADLEAAGGWLLRLAARERPDVIHLSEPVLAPLPWPAPTVAVGHSCVLSWWEAVLGGPAPESWGPYRDAMRRGFAAAAAVVAPSRAMLAALQRHYGVAGGEVVPNGRSPERFTPGTKAGFVLTATRLWDAAKNAATLDAAASGLAWPVYAAGDPQPPGGGEETCCGNLRLLGRLDAEEIARWLAQASVFALPARYEPFGLSALEAALAGCALVLGDIPSLRERWDGAAIFVPPDDAGTLRRALTTLIGDPSLRQLFAMRARRRALGLSPRRMALAYLEIYGRLLRESRAPTGQEATTCVS
jgi:glycosyltransferase involved in cell wall biosynthesis